jgi:hypothetical protein
VVVLPRRTFVAVQLGWKKRKMFETMLILAIECYCMILWLFAIYTSVLVKIVFSSLFDSYHGQAAENQALVLLEKMNPLHPVLFPRKVEWRVSSYIPGQ